MINYEKITRVDVGEICFTPDMVIQACKASVKAAIPLILEYAANLMMKISQMKGKDI